MLLPMFLRTLLATAALVALAATATADDHGPETKAGALAISDAWTRATAPSARNGGAFMTIRNTGSRPDRLIGAATPAANAAELHLHSLADGVMRMRPVDAIDVPAGGAAELKPGGLHVMMLGLKAPLAEGTTVPVTLTFEQAGALTVEVTVMQAGAAAMSGHGERMKDGHAKTDGDKPAMPQQ